ncbi:MAG: DUF1592 domain-containing protein [Verrucomicrobiales bacterium]|nr:DUF1592 domain-containing protein [Verrucomicrobiales bacterium]
MQSRSVQGSVALLLTFCASVFDTVAQDATSANAAVMPEKHFAVFEKYCLDCHDADTEKGKVNLEDLSFNIIEDIPTAGLWQDILDSINAGEMPPEDKKQISNKEKAELLRDLSTRMVKARGILSDSGGLITMRRLNRREYQNTLETLLGFRPDVSTLPDDDSGAGFDTAGASLFFSSDQFEQYRATATNALKAVLNQTEKPKSRTVRIEPEETTSKEIFEQYEEAKLRYEQAKAYLSQKEKPPTDFGFRDDAHAKKQFNRIPQSQAEKEDYIRRPEAKTGVVMTHSGNRTPTVAGPTSKGGAGGKYILRVRAGYYENSPERERYLEYRFGKGARDTAVLGYIKVTGTVENPVVLEIPVEHPPGVEGRFTIHQRDYKEKPSRNYINALHRKKNGIGQLPSLWVDYLEVEGPFVDEWPNPMLDELVPPAEKGEDKSNYARRLITRFATRAFREREPDDEFVDKLVARYLSKSNGGEDSRSAFIDSYALILSSPGFIYLREPREGDRPGRLNDREIAVRLSYFLWSSPPDEELLSLVKEGTLSDPTVLRGQTDRLLNDPRSDAFISAFAHQWLDMNRLDMFEFSARYHPEFDEAVRTSARGEVYATIRHLIDEKLPLQKLLKADFVLANNILADFYRLRGVEGSEFRKVSLPEDSPRGGLLGAAATHIMGSDGQRSSPVERGSWVLRHLLNDPPPPAPANVPMLTRFAGQALSARALEKAHQEQPQCAQCHEKIDPIGFGMENFTAAGLWRDMEAVELPVPEGDEKKRKKAAPQFKEFEIDPSGKLPRGETFSDYYELRDKIMGYSDSFSRGFTEHLIAYALGRPYCISDHNLATDIGEQAAGEGNVIPAFIHALVQSESFRKK